MNRTRRGALLAVVGPSLTGIVLGVVVGVLWWWITPTEQWVKLDGGLGAVELNSPTWFAADGWFLILGLVGGLVLAGASWAWARRYPVAMVLGLVVGAVLLAVVAWSVGGVLGPPDPNDAAASLDVGATVDGSLGLRALGVLGAPAVSALALVSLLLAMAPVVDGERSAVPDDEVGQLAS